ncbi:MAG: site-2 protease family protein [Patescibacteria group bacterium]|nr:site-2 protease family protein [Patescibacteria group bacterium]
MAVILFIVILVVLIVGHEAGHFVAAKLSGMKVPEFGLGFPPKLWGKKIGKTEYTVNLLPLGGFVKIYGEDPSETEVSADTSDAFFKRPKVLQAATLIAGPFMNILLAFLLSATAFMVGVPAALDSGYNPADIHGVEVTIIDVLPHSPAATAGILAGDRVVSVLADGRTNAITNPDALSGAISSASGEVTLNLIRSGKPLSIAITPQKNVVLDAPQQPAIGVATAAVGTLSLSFFDAVAAGFSDTIQNALAILTGLVSLIASAFTLSANLSSVSGPVGIAGLVGDAARFGLGSLLSFAALISINLGIINLFPFPALDGGRLALLAVETVIRRPVPPKIANAINAVGFAALIILMVVVTAHDVLRLVA